MPTPEQRSQINQLRNTINLELTSQLHDLKSTHKLQKAELSTQQHNEIDMIKLKSRQKFLEQKEILINMSNEH